jgi:hypothetical protein
MNNEPMQHEIDRLRATIALGRDMRRAQAEYFKTRSQAALKESKRLEREFDRLAAQALDAQQGRQEALL